MSNKQPFNLTRANLQITAHGGRIYLYRTIHHDDGYIQRLSVGELCWNEKKLEVVIGKESRFTTKELNDIIEMIEEIETLNHKVWF